MLQRIYGMNLGILCLLLLVVPIVWAKGCLWLRRNVQIRLNLLLLAAAVLAIGQITVWSRTPGEYAVVLRPLAALQAARQESEHDGASGEGEFTAQKIPDVCREAKRP